ncbi:phage tail protein [uncultured Brachyspira sp.]|uniref:phage tail protein n=1 Tax=uncultured Brachyspira sp. TaxID=221953 RepID=UPI0025D03CE2|nr:phage tail protein [uncultured Brachyspira sp.]
MSIFDLKGNLMNDEDGLTVVSGSNYKVRIAKTKKRDEKTDFTDDDVKGKYLIYPSSIGLTPTTETISKEYVGSPSSESYAGATTYAGDISYGAFPNTNAYYASLIWANVHTKETSGNLLCINSFNNFAIRFNKSSEDESINMLEIIIEDDNGYYSNFIDIYEGMRQKDLINYLKKIKNLTAFLITGNEEDEIDFSNLINELEEYNKENNKTEYLLSFKRVGLIESGIFDEDAKKQYPKYQSIISPRFGEPQYYNIALYDSSKNMDGNQYIGCESKSINFNFANKSMTEISSSLWALEEISIDKNSVLYEENSEERDVVMAQTSKYPTKLFINGTEATSVSDAALSFEWTKEEKFNISAKRYGFPNSKFTLSFSGNAVFNIQSKELFYDRVLNGNRQSFIISSKTRFKNKDYPFIFISCDVGGSPSFPAIEPKELSISLNNFKAVEQSSDMNSNYLIAFTDREDLF